MYKLPRTALEDVALNVKDFGAKGDGVTDDSAAIQAALDFARTNGNGNAAVMIPIGIFAIGTTLNLDRGVQLLGAGKGAEGSNTAGSLLKWIGAINETMVQVNSGTTGQSGHGWYIGNLGFWANNVAGVSGLTIGAGNLGTPRAGVGEVEACWFNACDYAGIRCWTAQICAFRDLDFTACTNGMLWETGTNHANTANLIENCRAAYGGIGFNIQLLTGATFVNCTAESNQDQGFYFETGDGAQSVYDVHVQGCWMENNLLSGGTNRGDLETKSTNSIYHCKISVENCHFGIPSAGNYNLFLGGTYAEVIRPWFPSGGGAAYTGGGSTTVVHAVVDQDPTTFWEYVSTGLSAWIHIEHHQIEGGLAPRVSTWHGASYNPRKKTEARLDRFVFGDRDDDAQIKNVRFCMPHYTAAEEQVALVHANCTSGASNLNLGGGTSLLNAATYVNLYAAANATTTTGTKIVEVSTSGVSVEAGNLDVVSGGVQLNSASKLYAATAAPVAGSYNRGDIVFNSQPVAGGTAGWICTTGGAPGTWKTFGTIEA